MSNKRSQYNKSTLEGSVLDAAGLGERCNYELPMSQEQLGDCTGLTAVHVNRMLRVLEDDGLIGREARAVRIADWKALCRVGDFEDPYLHLSPDQPASRL